MSLGKNWRFIWIIPMLIYTLCFSRFAYLFFVLHKTDAVWVAALLGWPSSLIAHTISVATANSLFGEMNFSIDLFFLFSFGLFQYGLIGFALQKIVGTVLRRREQA